MERRTSPRRLHDVIYVSVLLIRSGVSAFSRLSVGVFHNPFSWMCVSVFALLQLELRLRDHSCIAELVPYLTYYTLGFDLLCYLRMRDVVVEPPKRATFFGYYPLFVAMLQWTL